MTLVKLAAVVAFAASLGCAVPPEPAAPIERGEIRAEPVVNKWMGRRLLSSVVVSYENTTRQTFRAAVTIQCDALGSGGGILDTNQRSFFAHEIGAIEPGFRGTVKVPWDNEVEVASARCWIAQAR